MISEKTKDKIRQMSSKGQSATQIANKLDVDPKTVRKYAGTKKRGKEPQKMPIPENAGSQKDLDERGKLSARVFEEFNKGMKPVEVVEKLALAPEVVKELHDQWLELDEAGTFIITSQEAKELRRMIASVGSGLSGLSSRVTSVEKNQANNPLSGLKLIYECQHCRSKGAFEVPVQCRRCGSISFWGFS